MRVSVWYFSVTYVSLFLTALSPPAFLIWLRRLRMMWDSKWVPGEVPDTVKVITQVLESFTDSICCTKKQAQEGPVTCLGCKKLSNNPSSNLLATLVLSGAESLLAFFTISTAGVGCGQVLRYQDMEGCVLFERFTVSIPETGCFIMRGHVAWWLGWEDSISWEDWSTSWSVDKTDVFPLFYWDKTGIQHCVRLRCAAWRPDSRNTVKWLPQ